MATSNTYIEPTSNMSLNYARGVYNNALRAILTNFKSTGAPGSSQLNIDGVSAGVQDGMLYRSATTNALYIADTLNNKGSSIGGTFTRWGIGHRVEPDLTTLDARKTTYEIGELVATLNTGTLYLRTSNTNSINSFVDVGAPEGVTVEAVTSNSIFTGQSITATRVNAISFVSVGTAAPTQALDIRGGALITGTASVSTLSANSFVSSTIPYAAASWTTTGPIFNSRAKTFTDLSSPASTVIAGVRTSVSLFSPTFDSSNTAVTLNNTATLYIAGAPTKGTNTLFGNTWAMYVGSNGIFMSDNGTSTRPLVALRAPNNGIYAPTGSSVTVVTGGLDAATFSSTGDLTVTGDITAGGDVTANSDRRLKENVVDIDLALSKVLQMRGVYFNKLGQQDRSVGVIAQEIEEILPEVVITDSEGIKSVAYGNIVGILIEAIKELKTEIEILKGDK